MAGIALQAAGMLAQEGLQATVLNMHTIKPLDQELLVEVAPENRGPGYG